MFERTCLAGISYANPGGVELKLDLYLPELPENAPPPPLVVYMHGGGWVRGIRSGPSSVAFALEMTGEGFAFATIDYRLAPAHPAPAAIEDCKQAVRFLRNHAAKWGYDRDRILAMGNSAGGHLAAMLGLTRAEDGFEGAADPKMSSEVCAVIDLCGITDIPALLTDEARRPWAATWVQADDEEDRVRKAARFSPLTYAGRAGPPFLIVHGTSDASVPYDQAERFARALEAGETPCEFVSIPDSGHLLGVTGSVEVQEKLRAARRDFLKGLQLLPSGGG